MKMTWANYEAHRWAATPMQWRRMEAYFKEGKSLAAIGTKEQAGGRRYASLELSIGRGCMAVMRSTMGLSVRVPSEVRTAAEMRRIRDEDTRETWVQLSFKFLIEGQSVNPEPQAVVPQEVPAPVLPSTPVATSLKTSLFSGLSGEQLQSLRMAARAIEEDMEVEGHNRNGKDTGRVERIAGDLAVVIWNSGFRSFAPVAGLTPLNL